VTYPRPAPHTGPYTNTACSVSSTWTARCCRRVCVHRGSIPITYLPAQRGKHDKDKVRVIDHCRREYARERMPQPVHKVGRLGSVGQARTRQRLRVECWRCRVGSPPALCGTAWGPARWFWRSPASAGTPAEGVIGGTGVRSVAVRAAGRRSVLGPIDGRANRRHTPWEG
jgi:hypothetical protein